MTKSAFAQQEKVALTDLKNWHYRLPREKARQQAIKRMAIKRKPLRLVPVAVQPSGGGVVRSAGQVVVDVHALQIAVAPGADPAFVADLVAAIRKRTC